jgi:hemolysin D
MPMPPRRAKPRGSDQEFLAPELEILETPASPIRLTLIVTICLFFAVALIWAYVGRVDIISSAEGKIEPVGKVKVIQPQQPGRVARILAHNGDRVAAGQVLFALDATDARAQLDDLVGQLEAARGEVLRRRTAVNLIEDLRPGDRVPSLPSIAWPSDIPQSVRDREQGVLAKDLGRLVAELDSSESQIDQKSVDARSYAKTIAAQQSLVSTLSDLASMRQTLLSRQAGSKADWLDALQTQKTQEVVLAADESQQADNFADIEVLRREESKILTGFVSDYMQKLADVEKEAEDLAQKVTQARSQLDAMTLASPIDGIVQASALTTIGQVVASGQELMRIVPSASTIDIEAYLPNEDVGFVAVGQGATVKVAAFPFTQYGTISGKVARLGKDAVTAADAQRALSDPAHAISSPSTGSTAGATNNLVFPVTVRLDATALRVDGQEVPLTPGMGVTVEINTGSRRILEYLLSPLAEVTATAMHER